MTRSVLQKRKDSGKDTSTIGISVYGGTRLYIQCMYFNSIHVIS